MLLPVSTPLHVLATVFFSVRFASAFKVLDISNTRTSFLPHKGGTIRASRPRTPPSGVHRRVRLGMDGTRSDPAVAGPAPASAVDGDKNTPLFVYGTLMNEQVLLALLGRVPTAEKACLSGYHRYRIQGLVFPAVRPKAGSSVRGLYMPGLDPREKLIFDLFEDDVYDKVDVQVQVDGMVEGETKTATVYVWNATVEDQLYSTWDPLTHFTEDGPVPDYVRMVEGFARDIHKEGLLEETEVAV